MIDNNILGKLTVEQLYKWHQHRHSEVERLRSEMAQIDKVIAAKQAAAFVPNTQFPAQGVGGSN